MKFNKILIVSFIFSLHNTCVFVEVEGMSVDIPYEETMKTNK